MQAGDSRASDKNHSVEGTISMSFADCGLAGVLEFLCSSVHIEKAGVKVAVF